MDRIGCASAAAILSLLALGCSNSQVDVSAAQTRVIEAEPDAVLRAAEALLRQEFGGVRVEAQTRRITSDATEFTTANESGTARDLVRARSRMRRTAFLTVVEREGGSLARLRVDLERLDTARSEAVQPEEHRLSDSPGYSAIERDAATTRGQNVVWTRVGRDRAMERSLLTDLDARLNPRVQPAAVERNAAPEAAPAIQETPPANGEAEQVSQEEQ